MVDFLDNLLTSIDPEYSNDNIDNVNDQAMEKKLERLLIAIQGNLHVMELVEQWVEANTKIVMDCSAQIPILETLDGVSADATDSASAFVVEQKRAEMAHKRDDLCRKCAEEWFPKIAKALRDIKINL